MINDWLVKKTKRPEKSIKQQNIRNSHFPNVGMEQSGRGQPGAEIQILFRGYSHSSQDGREVTVVLSRWSRKLALQTHQMRTPGRLAQPTMKLSDGSAGKGCWPLGAADCPAPELDMEGPCCRSWELEKLQEPARSGTRELGKEPLPLQSPWPSTAEA